MKTAIIDLKKEYDLQGGTLSCLAIDYPWDGEINPEWKRPAVIVVPGGGYGMVSKREAEPVATAFLGKGFQAFILTYEIGGENGFSYPEQLLEVACAVDYVKKHAQEFGVNPYEVFVVGFSAGGHLTGNLAVEYASVSKKLGREVDCKPTGVGLCYPVITEKGHQGSYDNLLYGYSEEAKAELLKTLNLQEAVTENTPPAFLWATATDDGVPPAKNVLLYALACAKKGVPYELHVYPQGVHGLSTGSVEINTPANGLDRVCAWVDDCVKFFRLYIQEKF